jgi:hypothetical protein
MREIRLSGSEGGAGLRPRSYLYPGTPSGCVNTGTATSVMRITSIKCASTSNRIPLLLACANTLTIGHGPALPEPLGLRQLSPGVRRARSLDMSVAARQLFPFPNFLLANSASFQ